MIKIITSCRWLTIIAVFTCIWIFLLTYDVNSSNYNAVGIQTELAKLLKGRKLNINADNAKTAIVMTILRESDYVDYEPGLNTVKCYANYYGYQLHLLNLTADSHVNKVCNQSDVFFKRHCAVVLFLENNLNSIDYMLYLDADMGVINPNHTIDEYFNRDDGVEVIFYDRYYNHEIMAGSYLIKNSPYARKFLKYWADYFYRLPKSFHGTDNGCIHQVFMELNFETNSTLAQKCYPIWAKSTGFADLFRYQACTRYYLGTNQTIFCDGKVKLIRKGTWGYARDGWLTSTRWAPSDFIFHGWKVSKMGGEWQWPFKNAKFNQDLCVPGILFEANWQYKEEYRSTDKKIMVELDRRIKDVHGKYLQDIEYLQQKNLM